MPILEISALPQSDPNKIKPALKKTALAISEVYGCKPEQVWATWSEIKPGMYVEGETEALQQPDNTHPPIARLTCFEGKSADDIEKILKVAASTLSEALGIKDNIFISYQEAKSGQVITGNGIVRKN
jgi:phenylpyruvate tautomerase PptA (4-oxalocrotonate tautomerase family)